MRYLAERTAEYPLKTVSSEFDFHKTYHEEDLFVDIWAYKDQAHLSHHLHLLVPPVHKLVFTHIKPVRLNPYLCFTVKDYQIQVSQQEKVREAFAWELAGSMFIPYLIILPFAILL
jgi:two-component system OmpR family sensor kinase